MFKLEELVEAKIRTKKKATKGAIKYDGWTVNGTHYLGIMAVYMKSVKYKEEDVSVKKGISHTITFSNPYCEVCRVYWSSRTGK